MTVTITPRDATIVAQTFAAVTRIDSDGRTLVMAFDPPSPHDLDFVTYELRDIAAIALAEDDQP